MHFLAFVLGDDVDNQLAPMLSTDDEWVVSAELEKLCDDNEIPYPDERVLNVIRDRVGRTGKIAIVSKEQVPQACYALYQSGIEDFLTVEKGKFVTVNRVLKQEGKQRRDPEEQAQREELESLLKKLEDEGLVPKDTAEPPTFDSYEVGGMWANHLIAKDRTRGKRGPKTEKVEHRYDALKLKNIDWEAMYKEAHNGAEAYYDKVHKILDGRPVKPWKEYFDEHAGHTRQASQEYYRQEPIQDLTEAGCHFVDPMVFGEKEEYLRYVAHPKLMPFVVVHNGVTMKRGTLSWFGIVEDEIPWSTWAEKVSDYLESLNQETWLTVVDCHR